MHSTSLSSDTLADPHAIAPQQIEDGYFGGRRLARLLCLTLAVAASPACGPSLELEVTSDQERDAVAPGSSHGAGVDCPAPMYVEVDESCGWSLPAELEVGAATCTLDGPAHRYGPVRASDGGSVVYHCEGMAGERVTCSVPIVAEDMTPPVATEPFYVRHLQVEEGAWSHHNIAELCGISFEDNCGLSAYDAIVGLTADHGVSYPEVSWGGFWGEDAVSTYKEIWFDPGAGTRTYSIRYAAFDESAAFKGDWTRRGMANCEVRVSLDPAPVVEPCAFGQVRDDDGECRFETTVLFAGATASEPERVVEGGLLHGEQQEAVTAADGVGGRAVFESRFVFDADHVRRNDDAWVMPGYVAIEIPEREFIPGQRIAATFYNRAPVAIRAKARVSLRDHDAPFRVDAYDGGAEACALEGGAWVSRCCNGIGCDQYITSEAACLSNPDRYCEPGASPETCRLEWLSPLCYGGDWDAAWNTMVPENPRRDELVEPGGYRTLVFNITDQDGVTAPEARASAGRHRVVNLSFGMELQDPEYLVLTRVEIQPADTTPPPPISLRVDDSATNSVRLLFPPVVDPSTPDTEASGIRYYRIYRDEYRPETGDYQVSEIPFKTMPFHDFPRDPATSDYVFSDLTALPGARYRYRVAAIDAAVRGHYTARGGVQTAGNMSDAFAMQSQVVVDVPALEAAHLSPAEDFHYRGAFRLPEPDPSGPVYSTFGSAGDGLTIVPADGDEPASLLVTGHPLNPQMARVSIEEPALTDDFCALPRASFVEGFTESLYPARYQDDWGQPTWQPPGANRVKLSIGYHPGVDGVGRGVYYGMYREYASWIDRALNFIDVHGDTTSSPGALFLSGSDVMGPWAIDDDLSDERTLSPTLTDGFAFAVPQDFADAHLSGRSLVVGQGYQSGVGVPSHGPALFAIAPWEQSGFPGDSDLTAGATELLRYGSTDDDPATWNTGWNLAIGYTGGAYIRTRDEDGAPRDAIAIGFSEPRGDSWYGGADGSSHLLSDYDIPNTQGPDVIYRGPHATLRDGGFYLYDPVDLAGVASGARRAYEPRPYAVLRFRDELVGGLGTTHFPMGAIAYDVDAGRLYLLEVNGDRCSDAPWNHRTLVHVWDVGRGSSIP